MPKKIKDVVDSSGLQPDSVNRIGQVSNTPNKAVKQLSKLGDKLSPEKQFLLIPKASKSARKQRKSNKKLALQASRAKAAAISLAA